MLNRPATKIDLDLEEEGAEYEKMKEARLRNPMAFQSKYGSLRKDLNNSSFDNDFGSVSMDYQRVTQSNAFGSSSNGKEVSDFGLGFKNATNIKEFSIGNIFNSSSSAKANYSASNEEAFQTPHNK